MVLPRPAFGVRLRQTLLDPRSPLNSERIGARFVHPLRAGFVCHSSGTDFQMQDLSWSLPGVTPGACTVPNCVMH